MQANPAFYREFLRSELDRRVNKNPRYSLRAFSRFLGVDVGALSRLLANKQTITLRTANKICQNLGLDEEERRHFLDSVTHDRSKIGNKSPEVDLESLIKTLTDVTNIKLATCISRGVPCNKIRENLELELEEFYNRVQELIDLGVVNKKEGNLALANKFRFLNDL